MTINYLSAFKIKILTLSRKNMQERPWDLAASRSSAFGKHISSTVGRKARSQKSSGKTGCGENKNVVNVRPVMQSVLLPKKNRDRRQQKSGENILK